MYDTFVMYNLFKKTWNLCTGTGHTGLALICIVNNLECWFF